jgi:hypothetical protein
MGAAASCRGAPEAARRALGRTTRGKRRMLKSVSARKARELSRRPSTNSDVVKMVQAEKGGTVKTIPTLRICARGACEQDSEHNREVEGLRASFTSRSARGCRRLICTAVGRQTGGSHDRDSEMQQTPSGSTQAPNAATERHHCSDKQQECIQLRSIEHARAPHPAFVNCSGIRRIPSATSTERRPLACQRLAAPQSSSRTGQQHGHLIKHSCTCHRPATCN